MKSLTYHTTNGHSMKIGEDNITYVSEGSFMSIFTSQIDILDEKIKKKRIFLKKNIESFCHSKNKLYLCIAIEKQMHS